MSDNDHAPVPPAEGDPQAPAGQQPAAPQQTPAQPGQPQSPFQPQQGVPTQQAPAAATTPAGQQGQPQAPYQQAQPGQAQQQVPYAGQQGFQPFQNNAPAIKKKAVGLLSPADWAQSAIVAGITYVGMLLVSLAVTGIFAAVLSSDAGGFFSDLPSGIDTMFRDKVSGYLFFALTVQFVAMAQGGTFRGSMDVAAGSSYSASASATAHLVPLVVTVAGVLLLWFGSRFVARRSLSRGATVTTRSIWLSSLVTAVVFAVLTILLTVAFAGRASLDYDDASAKLHFWAFSWHLFVYPVVFGTLVGVWGRRSVMAPMPGSFSDKVHEFLPGIGVAAKAAGIYFGALTVVVAIVVAISAGVKLAASAAFGLLFFAPFLVVDLVSMGHFGGIVAKNGKVGSVDSDTYFLAGRFAQNSSHWPMLIWIGIVLGVVLLAFAWAGRRPQLNNAGSWIVMPLVFALVGVVVVWAGAMRLTGTAPESAYSSASTKTTVVAMGPAWWVPFMFLLGGVVVEVLARFAVPAVAGGLKGRARTLLLGTPAVLAFTPAHRFNNPAAAQPTGAPQGQPFAPQADPFAPAPGQDAAAGASAQPMQPVQSQPVVPTASGSSVAAADQVTAQSPEQPQDQAAGQSQAAGTAPFAQTPADQQATQPLAAQPAAGTYAASTQWQQPEQAPPAGPFAAQGAQTAQPGQPAQFASLSEPRTPMDPKTKKRVKLWSFVAGGLVLLLVLAFAGVKIVNATVFSPEKTVSAYFDAVKDGDADKATSTIDPNVSSDHRGLLTNDVYQAAGKKISDYDVKDVTKASDGETADATVEVTQDQKTSEVHVGLRKASSTLGVVQWEIDPTQGSGLYKTIRYQVAEGVGTVKVNGHDVTVPDSGSATDSASASASSDYSSSSSSTARTVDFTVLPGEYDFSAPQGGKYISYGEDQKVTASVDDSSKQQVGFHQQLTDQAKQDAATAAKNKLDQCVQQKSFELSACGIDSNYSGDDYRNPSWKITKYPTYVLSNSSSYSSAYGSDGNVDPSQKLYVAADKTGEAKLTYQYKMDDDWEDEDTTQTIYTGFPVTITADQITVGDAESSSY